jgi:putative MATE family efflux protein
MVAPIYIELALAISVGLFATWLVSRAGDSSAAAFSLTNHVTTLLLMLFRIVGAGISVSVANRIGAGDRDGASAIARNCFAAAVWSGAVVSLVVVFAAEPLLRLMRAPPDALPLATAFMQAMAVAVLLDALNTTLASVLRANLFVRDTLKVFVIANCVQAALAYWWVPRFGLPGYAAAVTLAAFLALCLHLLFSRLRLGFVPRWRRRARDWWHVDLSVLRPVLHVGIPAAAENVAYRLAFMVSVAVAGSLGGDALATQAYVLQINYGVLLSSLAIGLGVEIIVGHMIGARQFKSARQLVPRSLALGMLAGATVATLVALFGRQILSVFTQNPTIIATGAMLMWCNVLLEPGRSFNLIVINALRAAGDTRFPVLAGAGSMLVVLAGGSWLLCNVVGLGLLGVWIAYIADEWLRGLVMWWRWKSLAWVPYARATVRRGRAAKAASDR